MWMLDFTFLFKSKTASSIIFKLCETEDICKSEFCSRCHYTNVTSSCDWEYHQNRKLVIRQNITNPQKPKNQKVLDLKFHKKFQWVPHAINSRPDLRNFRGSGKTSKIDFRLLAVKRNYAEFQFCSFRGPEIRHLQVGEWMVFVYLLEFIPENRGVDITSVITFSFVKWFHLYLAHNERRGHCWLLMLVVSYINA